MPKPYSVDLRERIIKAYADGGDSQENIAKKYQIGRSTVVRYWKQYQEKGHIEPILEKSGRPSRLNTKELKKIREIVKKQPDITLAELGKQYNGRSKKPVGRTVLSQALLKLEFRRKKKSLYCTEQERSDIKK